MAEPKREIPTVGLARALLTKARGELAAGDPRQAAEKGWLALTIAGRATLRCGGDEGWRRTGRVADRVRALEVARKKPTLLSDGIDFIGRDLHGLCFYANDPELCGADRVKAGLNLVQEKIDHAATLCQAFGRPRSRSRR